MEVMQEASKAIIDFDQKGLSILEISHRSAPFVKVMDEAESLVRELLGVSDEYAVLFLTGGASTQFFMTAMNLLDHNTTAHYLNTGTWSAKAIKEANLFGNVDEIASSKDRNFSYIPKGYSVPDDSTYLHLTSNNTIFGTQIHEWPASKAPLVIDMSSDIFSQEVDVDRCTCIYAGAQKNMGPAGTTLVIIKKNALGKVDRKITSMLDYNIHISKGSMFNTPPVFPIYVSMLTMRWVKAQGGVKEMHRRNKAKAELIYNEIDRNPLFKGIVDKTDRSLMNATFVLNNVDHDAAFLKSCADHGISGLKGHRSVGGYRASMYNALPIQSVQVLVDVMQEFAQKNQ
ncbi:UNVERIFIED_CONTAM: hypothetical protein GTU68_007806 [Idotea baltica]|nr:hypothetical protein [Idotea baltica]